MLTYDFTNISGPVYQALYQAIKDDILHGRLKPDEKLPSKRTLARNLDISTITVENAYGQLISEGYVYSLPRRGFFVADLPEFSPAVPLQKESVIPPEPSGTTCRIDLTSEQTRPEDFPFSVWARLMRRTLSSSQNGLMKKSPCNGLLSLRRAIAGYLASFRGMKVDPAQIIIGAGTEYLYSLLIQLLGRDRMYCLENPGYMKLAKIYEKNQVPYAFAPMDESGITVEGLRAARADIAHICPTHHFPTGITIPASRRYELLGWANEKDGRYILEDDYDSEFRLNGRPLPSLMSIDMNEKVIYMNTFSKSLTPTIRISYMILPAGLMNRYYRELSFYSCTVSNFEQKTLSLFISEGYFEKHINRMRLFYSRKRRAVTDLILHSAIAGRCRIEQSDSGLHMLLQLDTRHPDRVICEELERRGIHLAALSEFYMPPSSRNLHLFLINYANLETDDLKKALPEIAEVI